MTSELDAGQAIAQSAIEVKEHDNVASWPNVYINLSILFILKLQSGYVMASSHGKMDKPISAIKFLNTLSVLHLGKSLLNNT